ncbi:Xaa-Pro aminopeptidase [Gracilaria domingensis]|nr:Xaa-Pro aminopeptidase [Gracilaria domingensis]
MRIATAKPRNSRELPSYLPGGYVVPVAQPHMKIGWCMQGSATNMRTMVKVKRFSMVSCSRSKTAHEMLAFAALGPFRTPNTSCVGTSLFVSKAASPGIASMSRVRRHTPYVPLRAMASQSAPAASSPRLAALREELKRCNVEAMVIPTVDPHFSEYAPSSYAYRNFISGFTGSAGIALVTLDEAYLWTDGRYFLQAEKQLDANWKLMKAGLPETPTITEFIAESLPKGSRLGIDPFLHSTQFLEKLREASGDDEGVQVRFLDSNPVETVWGTDRPPLPEGEVRVHDIQYAGKSVKEKLESLRESMTKKECSHMILSMLDEVCWLYNIRGSDIPHNPVVLAYALISKDTSKIYVGSSKLGPNEVEFLRSSGVEILPYENVLQDLRDIAQKREKVWLDPSSTSVALKEALGEFTFVEETPVRMAKACKNEAELRGMQEAHIRDGVALSSFLCWLEDFVNTNGGSISELEAATKLREFRAEQHGFLEESFPTIAGFGAHGAIIHYNPSEGSPAQISNKEVFLLDSGGQYVDGTTDVTRTMHLGGNASDHEKECFTRVLQGHIRIDSVVFPDDTTGLMLDALARVSLWNVGLDYRHGTGHGVGACLNVHEGPHSISPRPNSNVAALKEGMIVSNEPGYYEDGEFGIRIENLLYVVKRETAHRFGGKNYLGFERLTYVPLDTSMIKWEILSQTEVEWINNYHQAVWEKLSPRMVDGKYKEWLWKKTRAMHGVKHPTGVTREPWKTIASA